MDLQQKIDDLKKSLGDADDKEARYDFLISIGKALPPLSSEYKTEKNLVKGCQSTLYLRTFLKNGLLQIEAESDSLISAGLAALLVRIYSDEKPEMVLKFPPIFFHELSFSASLTPSRSNGFFYIYNRLKEDSINLSKISRS